MFSITQQQRDNAELVTANQLYDISEEPEFLAQTPVREDRFYNMYWKIDDKVYTTLNYMMTPEEQLEAYRRRQA